MELALEILRKRLNVEADALDEKVRMIKNYQASLETAIAVRDIYQQSVDGLIEAIRVLENYMEEHGAYNGN
jgi:hypothetical protein